MGNTRTTKPRTTATRRDSLKVNGLNLDTLKREGEPVEPYTCTLGGKLFTFSDPTEMEWQDAAAMDPNDIVRLIRGLLSEEDWEEFKQHRLELWKIVKLAQEIQAHYGVSAEDEGKDDTSPTS